MIIKGKQALHMARQLVENVPIYQGFECVYDMPCKINLGDFDFDARPALYYWVRVVNKTTYIGLAAYHWRDYTRCPFGKALKFLKGEHRHDFEGMLFRLPSYNPHGIQPYPIDVITVAHHRLIHWGDHDGDLAITIQARGHAIEPTSIHLDDIDKLHNPMRLKNVRLISYDAIRNIGEIRQEFNKNGVNLPDQWSHNGEYKGWFYNDPEWLFKVMEDE